TNLISRVNSLTHALILQFLESNKYKNTLAEFRKEANEIIENNPKLFDELPLTAIVQNYIMEEMRNDFKNMLPKDGRHFKSISNQINDEKLVKLLDLVKKIKTISFSE
ncbi:3510_t:CDS:2, partial [Racocetra fulgida]